LGELFTCAFLFDQEDVSSICGEQAVKAMINTNIDTWEKLNFNTFFI
jgi:hypothetical protein